MTIFKNTILVHEYALKVKWPLCFVCLFITNVTNVLLCMSSVTTESASENPDGSLNACPNIQLPVHNEK